MANFSFESQGTMTYLVYAISEGDSVDSMSLGMLTNNNIPGLAPAIFTQMDSTKFIKYNVTAKISVKQFFDGPVNKKRLLGVFNGIVDAMLSAEEYMIDASTIMLDLNYIFADVSSCKTTLICLPVTGRESSVDLASFFKDIMFSTQFDPTENCDHVARIMNYLNSTPVFSLAEFKSVLDSLGESASAQKPAVQPNPQPAPSPLSGQQKPIQAPPQPYNPQPEPKPQRRPDPVPRPEQVPPQQPPVANAGGRPMQIPSQPNPQAQTEKQISLFWLLQHYNKENKALYDAQKAAKKAAKNQNNPSAIPVQTNPQKPNSGFAVPGAPSNAGFAIPGQPAPQVNQPQVPTQQPAQPVHTPPVQTPPVKTPPTPQSYNPPAYNPPTQPSGSNGNFGDTVNLEELSKRGQTTLLGVSAQQDQVHPHLVRAKGGERIFINKPVFRIGKEKSYVDYFVGDNTAVSRSHCNIITKDGQYFIMDTNSTNHTYVNGGMIQSNVETAIAHGTKIRLANEEFEFRLY